MNDFEKFKEQLPGQKISDKENEHVLKVWNKFKMNMKDYCDFYLNWNYRLCPSHYLSAAALSWDAMLNRTKVELELIPDPDMYIFFKKGQEVEFLIFLIAIVKPTIGIWNLMTQNKNQNILYT